MCPYESRPDEEFPRAAKKAFAGAETNIPTLRVGSAKARIDLSRSSDPSRAIQNAASYLPGTIVTLVVAPRQRVCLAVDDLREHGLHLGRVDIECSDVVTQAVWVDALINGVHQWIDPLGGAA